MAFYLTISACILIGRRLPGHRGFAITASVVCVTLLPFFWFATRGHGPDMSGFVPYFAFGGGLYFATLGSRPGWLTVSVSVPLMLLQYVNQQAQHVPPQHIPFSWTGNLMILVVLLCIMTALAFVRFDRGRNIDRMLGDLTYPLYLYHEVVLIITLTVTAGYTYITFAAGVVLSFAIAAILTRAVDPAVNRYRDKVRDRTLQRTELKAGAFSPFSAPRQAPR